MIDENSIRHHFDYGALSEDHKAAAEEIAKFIKDQGHAQLGDLILQRFEIKQIPTYDLTQSKFYQECQKAGIFCATQGFLQEGSGLEAMQYPLCVISGDIRQLDKFIDSIKGIE